MAIFQFSENLTDEVTEKDLQDIDDGLAPALPDDLQHIPYKFNRYSNSEMIKRSSEFYQMMQKRRSVRFFSKDPVPEEVIRNIIKVAGIIQ